jgi:hypothetical protein
MTLLSLSRSCFAGCKWFMRGIVRLQKCRWLAGTKLPNWSKEPLQHSPPFFHRCLQSCRDIDHRRQVGTGLLSQIKIIMLLTFVFAAAVGGVLFTGVSGLLFANRLRRESWDCCPQTDATILTASVCPPHSGGPHVACVVYTYSVENERYSTLFVEGFATHREAELCLDEYRAHPLVARYRPEYPQESYLEIDRRGIPFLVRAVEQDLPSAYQL